MTRICFCSAHSFLPGVPVGNLAQRRTKSLLNGKAALSGSACVAEDKFLQFAEPQFPHTEEGRGKHLLLGAVRKKLGK